MLVRTGGYGVARARSSSRSRSPAGRSAVPAGPAPIGAVGAGAPSPAGREGRSRAGRDAEAWASEAELRGAGEIRLTSWDRDGTRSGADLALVHAVSDAVSVPVVCSGGIGSSDDAFQAIRAGADAILAASIFHDNELAVAELKRQLAAQKIPVRL